MHRLAAGDAGGLHLEAPGLGAHDLAPPVDGLAQRVDHAAEEGVAHGHREDVAGGADRLALLDVADLTQHDGADRVLVEVEREAEGAALELEQLVDGGAGQAADGGDAVADLGDAAHLGHLGDGVVALEVGGAAPP